jgi:hypothetical protein
MVVMLFLELPAQWRANSLVGCATADVARHCLVDLFSRRMRSFRNERGGLHNLSGLTVAALRDLFGNPGALHRVAAIAGQTFYGGDLPAPNRIDRRLTGANCLSIKMYCACSAHTDAAAILGAGHIQEVAQRPQQRHRWLGIDGSFPSIDLEYKVSHS